MKAARFVTGWLTVEITGAEPEKFLRALAERGMTFWDASPPRDCALRVSLPLRWHKLIAPMAQNVCCEARVVGRYGLPALFGRIRKRKTLIIGLALALAMLMTSRLFVWEVSVSGYEGSDKSALLAALADAGVDVGAYWPGFSQDMIRNAVLLEVPELRWVTVNTRGCRAEVIVRMKREPAAVLNEAQPARIVACTAGLVTTVRDERGTALAVPGQTVLPGDTLIEALATGRYDVQGVTRAIGEVWARTWYELSASVPIQTPVKTYTGQTQTRWALNFGKNRINFMSGGSICPPDCDKIMEEYKLAVQGVFTLPVALVRETWRSYTLSTAPAEDPQTLLREALASELAGRIGADGEVLSAVYTASEANGLTTVTLRAECLQQIGKTQILPDDQIAALQSQISEPTKEDNP